MGFIDKKDSKHFFIVTKIIFQINAFQIFLVTKESWKKSITVYTQNIKVPL